MRDENTPADLPFAQTAALFLHTKPGGVDGTRKTPWIDGMAVACFNGNTGLKARLKSEAHANGAAKPLARYFRAGPMPICRRSMSYVSGCGDPEAPEHLRVKAAQATVRFVRLKRNRIRRLIQNRWPHWRSAPMSAPSTNAPKRLTSEPAKSSF